MHSDRREVENCNHCRIVFSGAVVLDEAMACFEWALRHRSMTLDAPLPMGFENIGIRLQMQEMGRNGGMLLLAMGSFADWVKEARSWLA
jgi:hypothetical protein